MLSARCAKREKWIIIYLFNISPLQEQLNKYWYSTWSQLQKSKSKYQKNVKNYIVYVANFKVVISILKKFSTIVRMPFQTPFLLLVVWLNRHRAPTFLISIWNYMEIIDLDQVYIFSPHVVKFIPWEAAAETPTGSLILTLFNSNKLSEDILMENWRGVSEWGFHTNLTFVSRG